MDHNVRRARARSHPPFRFFVQDEEKGFSILRTSPGLPAADRGPSAGLESDHA